MYSSYVVIVVIVVVALGVAVSADRALERRRRVVVVLDRRQRAAADLVGNECVVPVCCFVADVLLSNYIDSVASICVCDDQRTFLSTLRRRLLLRSNEQQQQQPRHQHNTPNKPTDKKPNLWFGVLSVRRGASSPASDDAPPASDDAPPSPISVGSLLVVDSARRFGVSSVRWAGVVCVGVGVC
jgi:hypothetical protein